MAHSTFALLLFASAACFAAATKGPLCSSHPLYTAGMSSQIIRSWSYAVQDADGRQYFTQSAYFPQYKQHSWAPQDNPASTKFAGLDYFTTYSGKKATENFVTLNFQRPAKLYLLVHAYVRGFPPATLAGWTSEGWVERKEQDAASTKLGLGSHKAEMHAPSMAYAFSQTGEDVVIPDAGYIAANIGGITAKGYFSALVAEEDGSPIRAPTPPAGMVIPAGGRCPDALHDKWTAPGTDAADTQTFGKSFETWHPLWDPCFWCAYDHEHGSAAKELMGYTPRYGYTALKNKLQDESPKGFKDIVISEGDFYFYFGIHAHMSKASRFNTQFHTVVMAATDKATKTLQMELRFKADYGMRAVRLAPTGEQEGVSPEDKQLFSAREESRGLRQQRLVNVVNMAALDPKFDYRDAPDQQAGQYEQWGTGAICTATSRFREPTVDFKDMGLALKSTTGNETTMLGRTRDGVFVQSPSTNRQLRGIFEVGDKHCMYKLRDIMGKPAADGSFYTDAYGKKILGGAGPDSVKQFIKPGFSISLNGTYETVDTWLGVYEEGKMGSMRNVALAVDETEN